MRLPNLKVFSHKILINQNKKLAIKNITSNPKNDLAFYPGSCLVTPKLMEFPVQ